MTNQGGEHLSSEVARVYAEYKPEHGLTVANFVWPEGAPEHYFDIGVDDFLSIRFDADFAVRPDTITLHDTSNEEAGQTLEQFFGTTAAQAINGAKSTGFNVIETVLTTDNRVALAELQADSPTTPRLIRLLAEAVASQSETRGTRTHHIPLEHIDIGVQRTQLLVPTNISD